MSCTRLFGGLISAAVLVVAVGVEPAAGQCASCAAPAAVAYAPAPVAYTTAYAPAPVVYQTYRPATGWYPGALLDRWRLNRWSARTAYTTAYGPTYTTAYAPTYTTAYAAAYTPTYPPSYYGVSYAPTYTTAYRPAYPLGYSVGYATTVAAAPVSACATCADPYDSSRPVVMSAVVDGCSTCAPACSTCADGSYVAPATYETSGSGCAGCATGATSTYITPSSPPPAATNGDVPPPAIPPSEPTPVERTTEKPAEKSVLEEEKSTEPAPPASETETTPGATMFQSPELFDPGGRVTQRPHAPVWTAVYHAKAAAGQRPSQQISSSPKAKPTAADVARDAQGWTSAGK